MPYKIKEIELHNKNETRKKLIIEFSNPACSLLGEFLNVDASLLSWYILHEVKAILADEKEKVESSGNRTSISITKEQTKIEDMLDGIVADEDLLAPVIMETEKFHRILVKWYETIEVYNNQNKS